MIKVMWVSGFFYGASVLSKSVTELAFSFADVLHVTFIALDYVNEIGYAMLMSPNKGETAVHDCHCPGDMAVRMREVLARPWVGYVPLALNLSNNGWAGKYLLTIV